MRSNRTSCSAAAALAADPAGWLPGPARPRGLHRWTVELVAGPMARAVTCHVGGVWWMGSAAWRTIGWQPEPEAHDVLSVQRALPVLSGKIGVHSRDGRTVLTLRGSYTAPGGRVGAAADSLALNRAARATAERFVADVADRLER